MKRYRDKVIDLFRNTDKFSHQAATVVGWTAISQIIMFLGIPFVSRIFTPEAFGVYAVYAAVIYILNGVVSLGCELLIPNPSSDEEGATLFWVSIINLLLVTIVISILLLISNYTAVWETLNLTALSHYQWLIVFGAVAIGLRNCLLYWFTRIRRFNQVGKARFLQAPVIVFVQVGVGYLYPHPDVLIIGGVLSWLISDIYLLMKLDGEQRKLLRQGQATQYFSVLQSNKAFFSHTTSSLFLLNLSNYLPTILFAISFDPAVAALYALAYQAFSPLDLISNAIIQLYIGEGNRIVRNHPLQLKTFYKKMLVGLSLITIVPITIAAIWGGPIFGFVFGAKWYHAGVYAQIMAFAMMMRFVVIAASQNLAVLKKQGLNLAWSSIYIVLILAAFIPANLLAGFTKAEYTIVLLSCMMMLSYFILVLLNFGVIHRQIPNYVGSNNNGFREQAES
ncbi:MAG: hypothetical protein CMF50_07645 [Legionellales bacterium]|nr:hypothetical protein [Legionellales bacterium]|tara:strand:- start:28472 stop:29821 length:1350 start_codon:yes stop_codon:yes gene_type:complete